MNAIFDKHLRELEVIGYLEHICRHLELSPTQHALAKSRYEAIGRYLGGLNDPILSSLLVYPHGSVAIGTTVKPYHDDEHDVDLMSLAASAPSTTSPGQLKRAIGDALRANSHYAPIVEEKRRCWRINYAGDFHLDITPSIKNLHCPNEGELVPDKDMKCWKPTNPKGYRELFDKRASLQPRIRFPTRLMRERADVAPFPEQTVLKGLLRRIVQLIKRHRDMYFDRVGTDLAPISIILTTLAARAYEYCVANEFFESEMEIVNAVVRAMPMFVEREQTGLQPHWAVWNETTVGENFAEKWNTNPALASSFYTWHTQLVDDFARLNTAYGRDQLAEYLAESFGKRPANVAMDAMADDIGRARASGLLSVSRSRGLSTVGSAATMVRPNTFYGVDD